MRVEWPSILLGGDRLGTETYPAENQPVHFVVTEQHLLISYAAAHSIRTSPVDLVIVFCKPHLTSFYSASGWEMVDGIGTRGWDTGSLHRSSLPPLDVLRVPRRQAWTIGVRATPALYRITMVIRLRVIVPYLDVLSRRHRRAAW